MRRAVVQSSFYRRIRNTRADYSKFAAAVFYRSGRVSNERQTLIAPSGHDFVKVPRISIATDHWLHYTVFNRVWVSRETRGKRLPINLLRSLMKMTNSIIECQNSAFPPLFFMYSKSLENINRDIIFAGDMYSDRPNTHIRFTSVLIYSQPNTKT